MMVEVVVELEEVEGALEVRLGWWLLDRGGAQVCEPRELTRRVLRLGLLLGLERGGGDLVAEAREGAEAGEELARVADEEPWVVLFIVMVVGCGGDGRVPCGRWGRRGMTAGAELCEERVAELGAGGVGRGIRRLSHSMGCSSFSGGCKRNA